MSRLDTPQTDVACAPASPLTLALNRISDALDHRAELHCQLEAAIMDVLVPIDTDKSEVGAVDARPEPDRPPESSLCAMLRQLGDRIAQQNRADEAVLSRVHL